MPVYIFTSILSLLVPFGAALWITRRHAISTPRLLTFLAVGAIGWLIAKIPKGIVVLPVMFMRDIPFQMSPEELEQLLASDLLFLVVAAVSAGVFEELFKPAGLLLMRTGITRTLAAPVGWIVGIGAGLIETLNFLGGGFYAILGPAQADLAEFIHLPLERAMITFFHGALTAIVVYFVTRKRYLIGLGVPILIHFAIDLSIPYAQVHGFAENIWTVQAVIFVWVALTCRLALRLTSGGSRPEN